MEREREKRLEGWLDEGREAGRGRVREIERERKL